MSVDARVLRDERSGLVRYVTDRVATRLVEAIERDEAEQQEGTALGRTPLVSDARRQQLLVGAWLSEEIALVNQDRMHRGDPPLAETVDRDIRARVVAELTGTGPLEPYMSDPGVEEIDVNSHLSTWVVYSDGRKIDVGALWESSADLTAYQKRLARRMTGTGEGWESNRKRACERRPCPTITSMPAAASGCSSTCATPRRFRPRFPTLPNRSVRSTC